MCEATMCWIMTERQFEREGMHVIRLLTCNRGLFKQFVRQYRSGPPLEFPLASSNHSIRTMCGMYKGQGRSRSKLETFLFTIIFSLACRLFSLYYCTWRGELRIRDYFEIFFFKTTNLKTFWYIVHVFILIIFSFNFLNLGCWNSKQNKKY